MTIEAALDARPAVAAATDDPPAVDVSAYVQAAEGGLNRLHLVVEGVHCGGCVRRIERALEADPAVADARVNLTTRRLALTWRGPAELAERLVARITGLGYRVAPFEPAKLTSHEAALEKQLLRAMAVAGFAAGNIMLLSVSVWAGHFQGMGEATRSLLHWFSALVALPAIAYAGRPFFHSAAAALAHGRTNMDVPIALAIVLASGMSLFETMRAGPHVYFDSAIMLLFFLLLGRYLDRRARGRARSVAERLLMLDTGAVTVLEPDGRQRALPSAQVTPGMTVLAAAGERIGVDGRITAGGSEIDTSLITGETVPRAVQPGDPVFAGTLNLGAPLRLEATAIGERTLLAEIVRLMEHAEQRRARHVVLADRIARRYAPVVHGLALATFLGWMLLAGVAWQSALLVAIAVLIITCPCALGLAVPAVQVIASGRLLTKGIILKSASALERLAKVDTVVFDKTGTLTVGRPALEQSRPIDRDALALAASLAGASRHPLARALCRAAPDVATKEGVEEVPGRGLRWQGPRGEIRLGSRAWCGIEDPPPSLILPRKGGGNSSWQVDGSAFSLFTGEPERSCTPSPSMGEGRGGGVPQRENALELWLARPDAQPVRFAFHDPLRPDAEAVVGAFKARGLDVILLSGDRAPTVAAIAEQVGIASWQAGCTPADKAARLEELAASGRHVLMVGDGLNDAPALVGAHVSLSPSSAVDISQNAADAVFQGERLQPVLEVLSVAARANRLVRQNFALALGYNVITVPIAVAGLVTPLIAALCMSASSLAVVGNALRLGRGRTA